MEQKLKDRLHDTQVCSPAQNYCRNRHVMEEAAMRIEELGRRLDKADALAIEVQRRMNDLGGFDNRFTLRKALEAYLSKEDTRNG